MQAIAGQVKQLEKIVESNPPSRMPMPASNPSPRQRTTSSSSGADGLGAEENDSEGVSFERSQSMERDATPISEDLPHELKREDSGAAVEELIKEGSSYECSVS